MNFFKTIKKNKDIAGQTFLKKEVVTKSKINKEQTKREFKFQRKLSF